LPISIREYDTYRKTVKVPKGLDYGQAQGHRPRQESETDQDVGRRPAGAEAREQQDPPGEKERPDPNIGVEKGSGSGGPENQARDAQDDPPEIEQAARALVGRRPGRAE